MTKSIWVFSILSREMVRSISPPGSPITSAIPEKDLPVVQFNNIFQSQAGENFIHDLYQFHFIQQGIAADHIYVALENSR